MWSVTRSRTVREPVASTLTLRELSDELVVAALADHPAERIVTLLAISVSGLVEQPDEQLELAVAEDDPRRAASASGAARMALDRSVDAVRTAVPDEFRELAERSVRSRHPEPM